jgi:uncharacterized protein YciI
MKCLALNIALLAASSSLVAEPGPGGYEMTTYYVAFLYRGPAWTPKTTPETEKIQNDHLANIQRLAAAGKLVLAGPFTDDGPLRGIFVFQGVTREEAEQLCASDPAVKAGRLRIELHPWYAAKGIRVDQPKNGGASRGPFVNPFLPAGSLRPAPPGGP